MLQDGVILMWQIISCICYYPMSTGILQVIRKHLPMECSTTAHVEFSGNNGCTETHHGRPLLLTLGAIQCQRSSLPCVIHCPGWPIHRPLPTTSFPCLASRLGVQWTCKILLDTFRRIYRPTKCTERHRMRERSDARLATLASSRRFVK